MDYAYILASESNAGLEHHWQFEAGKVGNGTEAAMSVPRYFFSTWPNSFDNMARALPAALRGGLWYRRSIRWHLLATFVLVSLAAGLTAFVIMLYNAQRATRVEIASAMELAEHLVRGPVEQLAQETSGASPIDQLPLQTIEALPLRIRNLRHVRIQVQNTQGRIIQLSSVPVPGPVMPVEGSAQAPAWFVALFRNDNRAREIPVTFGGRHVGSVLVIGQSSDEAAEVWEDLSEIGLVAFVASLCAIGLLYLALGRILHPLKALARGLQQLERGHFQYRLSLPRVRELADIAQGFNALAGALDEEKARNAQLNRRLITVQDDERRQIAMELHDELGPCLFGLKANLSSVGLCAKKAPDVIALEVRERIETLLEIVDRIQTTNRRVLKKILPMAVGHAPLADVIATLVADFSRHAADFTIDLKTRHVARSYGDCADLTVYRCVQEGLTNAVRHAGARSIEVAIEQIATSGLSISIADDGRGIASNVRRGLGLTAMEERVRALGGTVKLANRPSGGTSLLIDIPLQP